jgi:hypothetical protein
MDEPMRKAAVRKQKQRDRTEQSAGIPTGPAVEDLKWFIFGSLEPIHTDEVRQLGGVAGKNDAELAFLEMKIKAGEEKEGELSAHYARLQHQGKSEVLKAETERKEMIFQLEAERKKVAELERRHQQRQPKMGACGGWGASRKLQPT